MTEFHPLYDNYLPDSGFVVRGHALAIIGEPEVVPEKDIPVRLEANSQRALVISDPVHVCPRFWFDPLQSSSLPKLMRPESGFRFSFSGDDLGRVEHMVGYSVADLGPEGWGRISQKMVTLEGEGSFGADGLRLLLRGRLSERSSPTETVLPNLYRERYDIDLKIPWRVLRFMFSPVHVVVWYEHFGGDSNQ
jgi:hypothetical protein